MAAPPSVRHTNLYPLLAERFIYGALLTMRPETAAKVQQAGCALTGLGCWMLVGFPVLILILLVFFAAISGAPTERGVVPGTPAIQADGVSMAQFEQISAGMSYANVVRVFDGEGEVMSESTIADGVGGQIHTIMLTWPGNGALGSNVVVMFQNDKMIQKSQFGLE